MDNLYKTGSTWDSHLWACEIPFYLLSCYIVLHVSFWVVLAHPVESSLRTLVPAPLFLPHFSVNNRFPSITHPSHHTLIQSHCGACNHPNFLISKIIYWYISFSSPNFLPLQTACLNISTTIFLSWLHWDFQLTNFSSFSLSIITFLFTFCRIQLRLIRMFILVVVSKPETLCLFDEPTIHSLHLHLGEWAWLKKSAQPYLNDTIVNFFSPL